MTAIHQLLDRLADALAQRGLEVVSARSPVPDQAVVRQQLLDAGMHDRHDLVELFTWSGFERGLELFWETSTILSLGYAIDVQQRAYQWFEEFRSDIDLGGDITLTQREQAFPGPAHWLPIFHLDGAEFMSIDARPDPEGGAIWFLFNQSPPRKIFDSLEASIETAVYCVEAGLWEVDDQRIVCDRNSMPSLDDLTDPPWAGHGEPPSLRLIGFDSETSGFLLFDGETDHAAWSRVTTKTFERLLASGAPTVAMNWPEMRLLPTRPGSVYRDLNFDRVDSSVQVVDLDLDSTGCYLSARYPGRKPRLQWMTPDETRHLVNLGFDVQPEIQWDGTNHPTPYHFGNHENEARFGEPFPFEDVVELLQTHGTS